MITRCEQCGSRIFYMSPARKCPYCKMVLCSDCYKDFHPCLRNDIDVEASVKNLERNGIIVER